MKKLFFIIGILVLAQISCEKEALEELQMEISITESQKMYPTASFPLSTTPSPTKMMLYEIRLSDDKENRLRGKADIYAIISGFKDEQKNPLVKKVQLKFLDHDKRIYRPENFILVDWTEFKLNTVRIELWEHDCCFGSGHFRNEFVDGEFANMSEFEALDAIYQKFIYFGIEDDKVDLFKYVEKNRNYYNHFGSLNNARVKFFKR
ncbi:DUF3103 family protein [Aquimarina spongiae]|uniref:Uncharacterized protein n=1 Tax=Aquimarina spongiae TaxID=570521 RepID=A0A1M6F2N0_9FLAO|nr:DUF3103 family protein [Aquimarina spongiae]SHI91933.1 Protein of unknown function [Aquimarina spongiae]